MRRIIDHHLTQQEIEQLISYGEPIEIQVKVPFEAIQDSDADKLLNILDKLVFNNTAGFIHPLLSVAGCLTPIDEQEQGDIIINVYGDISIGPSRLIERTMRNFSRTYPDDEMRIGYFDDKFFGSPSTDPTETVLHEIFVLDNETLISDITLMYRNKLDAIDRHELSQIQEKLLIGQPTNESDKEAIIHCLKKILDDRNYCKWLCPTAMDIIDSYIAPFSHTSEFNQRLKTVQPLAYIIALDAIPLTMSDPNTGVLMAWHKRETDSD